MSEGAKPSSKQSTFREPSYKKITDFDAFDYVEQPKKKRGVTMYKLPNVDMKSERND